MATCNNCKAEIVWHKSKAGKNYPCNSQNRRDFHNCEALKPDTSTPAKQFETSLEITDEDIPF